VDLFTRLRRYAHAENAAEENYLTEILGYLLSEFPNYRKRLMTCLLEIDIAEDATVETQVGWPTSSYGKAILDLVVQDASHFVMIEVKVEAGLNEYEFMGQNVDQLQKYEDCSGLPEGKVSSIHTLTKHPINSTSSRSLPFSEHRWFDVFQTTEQYVREKIVANAEEHLLKKFLIYLEVHDMAGFRGFSGADLEVLSNKSHLDSVMDSMASAILATIPIPSFTGKHQSAHGRDGVIFEFDRGPAIKIFVGLWISDQAYQFKFDRQSGPQVMAFVEIPPNHKWRPELERSNAFNTLLRAFDRQPRGYQALLKHCPLNDFIDNEDQSTRLLNYWSEAVSVISEAGLVDKLEELSE